MRQQRHQRRATHERDASAAPSTQGDTRSVMRRQRHQCTQRHTSVTRQRRHLAATPTMATPSHLPQLRLHRLDLLQELGLRRVVRLRGALEVVCQDDRLQQEVPPEARVPQLSQANPSPRLVSGANPSPRLVSGAHRAPPLSQRSPSRPLA
eukprot:9164781-Pyramimonas_sp.AAC.3